MISMKISPSRVEKYLIFKFNFIIEDNDRQNFLFFSFFLNPPPPMKREVTFHSVVVYDNYQYFHQVASRFIKKKKIIKKHAY